MGIVRRLLARLSPRQELPTEPGHSLGMPIENAARQSDIGPLLAMDEAVVQAWARVQAERIEQVNATIHSVPWYYPVHPYAMHHFVERGWWGPQHVQGHLVQFIYSMENHLFGGNLGTFFQTKIHGYTNVDADGMVQWTASLFELFDLPADVKASFLGHTLSCLGAQVWAAQVLAACAAFIDDVELDVLFAVSGVPLAEGVPLEMTPELDTALRETLPSDTRDDDDALHLPYRLPAMHAHFPLRYSLEEQPVWSRLDLYRLGAWLKRMETSSIESFALPEGLAQGVLV